MATATLTPSAPASTLSAVGSNSAPAAPPTGPLSPGQQFGSRYRILKLLGAGGMGVVYQAWDESLDLPVALKVIRPEAIADRTAAEEVERRFKRELVLARQVTHRNVVRIHDLGEIDGVNYISMPFLEGRDLATVLAEAGRLPLPAALDIVRQVGAGLEAAHEAGVVHRDLKPENVMVTADGRAVIMDFGISRAVSGATTLGLTAAGSVVGTIEYMAPEQALGQTVDQRADVYALGLIAYDVMAGRQRLATVTTPVTEMMQRLQHAPPPLRTKVPEVPAEIERIVARALEPDPANRYQHVRELLADLDAVEHGRIAPSERRPRRLPVAAIAAAALVVVLTIGIGAWWLLQGRAPAGVASPSPMSVLIADFENRAGEPLFEGALEQALGIGLEGAPFITTYARRDALVIAERSGQTKPGGPLSEAAARLVAQREGVKVVLAGSVGLDGGRYRLLVRALDPVPGQERELARAEATADNKAEVLQAVARVASRLREALGDTTPESEKLAAAETFTASSLEAARHYALGQQLQSNGRYEQAIENYRRAVQSDQNFGRAYASWAVSAFALGRKQEAADLYKRSFGLLDRMTEREKYRTLGGYALSVAGNYNQAVDNYGTLVRLYPADRAGHSNLALAYFQTLNFPKALEHGRRALEIYRGSPKFRSNLALYAMYAGDFATAAREARSLLQDEPDYYRAYLPIAAAALAAGDLEEARRAYEAMRRAGPQGISLASIGLADLQMYAGRYAEAVTTLEAGIAHDRQIKNAAGLAAKQVALAEAFEALRDAKRAIEAAAEALAAGRDTETVVPAGRVLLRHGRVAEATALSEELSSRLQSRPRAYGKLLEGETALRDRRISDGVTALLAARQHGDLWLPRFVLGTAYVNAGHYAEALSELDTASKRRGEATAIFLDDVPTFRYLATLPYWLARAQEGLGMREGASANYKAYLKLRPGDALAADALERLK
ncbi:MAG TPA: protein kinase [Vicinamibacterales bacterium]|nr:protein kinase [Vicinamibacterales bacterium]